MPQELETRFLKKCLKLALSINRTYFYLFHVTEARNLGKDGCSIFKTKSRRKTSVCKNKNSIALCKWIEKSLISKGTHTNEGSWVMGQK